MNINATLLGQTLAFVIFVAICWKYVWPPIIAIMEEREKRIADGLEAAKKADDSLEEAKLAFDQEMNKAKAEAAEILEKANSRASQIVNDAAEKAEVEAEKILSSASKTSVALYQVLAVTVLAAPVGVVQLSPLLLHTAPI